MSADVREYIGTGKKIRVERSIPCCPQLNGYLLDASKTLGLMHCFHDFMPDGFAVFRLADVTGVRSGKHERLWDRMLAGEGLLTALSNPPRVDLCNLKTTIDSIRNHYQGIIIESEDPDEDTEDFYIGSVLSTNGNEVRLQHFDALGVWKITPEVIPYNDITLIQFDTPYINRFWKYLAGPSPS